MEVVDVPLQHFLMLFAVTWCVVASYVGAFMAAAFRVRRLERPDEPLKLMDMFRAPPRPAETMGLLMSGRHKALGDPLTTRLVLVARVLLAIAALLMLLLFWQASKLA